MSQLVPFDSGNVPAHIAALARTAPNEDLTAGTSMGYPILRYKGKTWSVGEGDTRTVIMNDDGDPRASLEIVIFKANSNISKVYYPDGFEEGTDDKPDCYSHNGTQPALDASAPQAISCAVCPHNAWGSKISEHGSKGKACSDSRRLAVASIHDLETPMLLRVPAASLKELSLYAGILNRQNAPYYAVVTKVSFDAELAYPKLLFKALRYLTNEEMNTVLEVQKETVITDITAKETFVDYTPMQIEGTKPAAATKPVAEPMITKPSRAVKQPPPEQEQEVVSDGFDMSAIDAALAALDD